VKSFQLALLLGAAACMAVVAEPSWACGYKFLTHSSSACRPKVATAEIPAKVLVLDSDRGDLRGFGALTQEKLVAAGYAVELIRADQLSQHLIEDEPNLVIGEYVQMRDAILGASSVPARFLPVLVRPSQDELDAARERHRFVLAVPGRISQLSAVVAMALSDKNGPVFP
jgi:hypothetical protein